MTISEFWDHVVIEEDCWRYSGPQEKHGYGYLNLDGVQDYAHRVAWRSAYQREIPRGMVVMHSCDNRFCVNPFHLSLGTKSDNARDMFAKDRQPDQNRGGELSPTAKLTWDDVADIRLRFSELGQAKAALARRFGVSSKTIANVVAGKTWIENKADPGGRLQAFTRRGRSPGGYQ